MPLKTDKALKVTCPKCCAIPGELCWDLVLRKQRRKAHWERVALAKNLPPDCTCTGSELMQECAEHGCTTCTIAIEVAAKESRENSAG